MFKSIKYRIRNNELLSIFLIKLLILITIVITFSGVFSPIFGSNDSTFYSVIAKNIVSSNDWINLTFAGHDWLDKPHFPFWLTAISYKVFGVSTFAYIFIGFLFHLIGGYYTYRLGTFLYDKKVGLLAMLFYFTSLHLMLSAIDVRAEAFLLGEITPACYYWLRYNNNEKISIKYLLLGAIFTAMALMTKGIFVLLTISSGLIAVWIYTGKIRNILSRKWILALLLSFVFILPELISLYLQFDSHPEKLIFGKTHVSGLRFFFLDSQFGRFFDTGPITSGNAKKYSHLFFFIHTFMWSFLPWTIIFLGMLWHNFKILRLNLEVLQVRQQKINSLFLLFSFIPTFILFSCTRFQLDHYTNILIPFACILCASWVYNYLTRFARHKVFYWQIVLSSILLILVSLLSFLLFHGAAFIYIEMACVMVLLLFLVFIDNNYLNKAIVYSVLSINLVFIFAMLVNNTLYIKYDAGYQIARYLADQPASVIYDYNVGLDSLNFHTDAFYKRINQLDEISRLENSYILIRENDKKSVESVIPDAYLIGKFDFIPQNKFISGLFHQNKRDTNLQHLLLYKVY